MRNLLCCGGFPEFGDIFVYHFGGNGAKRFSFYLELLYLSTTELPLCHIIGTRVAPMRCHPSLVQHLPSRRHSMQS